MLLAQQTMAPILMLLAQQTMAPILMLLAQQTMAPILMLLAQQTMAPILMLLAQQTMALKVPASQDKISTVNLTQKNFRSLRISIGTLVFWLPRNLRAVIEASLAVFGLAERIGGGQSASAICAT